MYFDRNNATLLASTDELTALAQHRAADPAPAPSQDWQAANIAEDGRIDATVAGIVDVLNRPCRSIALERFDGERVDVTFVAWDRAGRATMANGVGGDSLAITATQFDLLPALLTQSVRLHSGSVPGARPAIATTADVVQRAIEGQTAADTADTADIRQTEDGDLQAVLGCLRHAWRASGSWHGKQTDTSITVLYAGDEGLWTVEHDAAEPGSRPSCETVVHLTPCTAAEVGSRLGDVVTGRKAPASTVAAAG